MGLDEVRKVKQEILSLEDNLLAVHYGLAKTVEDLESQVSELEDRLDMAIGAINDTEDAVLALIARLDILEGDKRA